QQFARTFDTHEGGFGGAPKFPRPVTLKFLTRFHARNPDSDSGQHALEMVLLTLRKMAAGGMHDHIGGGFHRYSVDAYWHVPHFEKMLYDQAQLASAYLDAFLIVRHSLAETARFRSTGVPPVGPTGVSPVDDKDEEAIRGLLAQSRQKLFSIRNKRARPHLDDKIIAAWNGLMISGFARGAQVLNDASYLETATRAGKFIRANLYDESRKILFRSYREGRGEVEG